MSKMRLSFTAVSRYSKFSPRKSTGPKIAWGETYERGTHVQSNYSEAVLGNPSLTKW